VNRKLNDKCPACDRNGLPAVDKNKEQRRRCSLCRAEEPRPQDRTVYLACVSGVTFVEGKGAFLSGFWSAHPYLSRKEADTDLAAYAAAATERWAKADRRCTTEPMTVDWYSGTVLYTNSGPEFLFIQEKLMDCSAILPRGRTSTDE
jgi:hypothetical protein